MVAIIDSIEYKVLYGILEDDAAGAGGGGVPHDADLHFGHRRRVRHCVGTLVR